MNTVPTHRIKNSSIQYPYRTPRYYRIQTNRYFPLIRYHPHPVNRYRTPDQSISYFFDLPIVSILRYRTIPHIQSIDTVPNRNRTPPDQLIPYPTATRSLPYPSFPDAGIPSKGPYAAHDDDASAADEHQDGEGATRISTSKGYRPAEGGTEEARGTVAPSGYCSTQECHGTCR